LADVQWKPFVFDLYFEYDTEIGYRKNPSL